MFLKFRIILFLFLFVNVSYSQKDSTKKETVKYSIDFRFSEGIYLNFDQFKKNNPIPASRIITSLDYNSYDFYEKLFQEDVIFIYDQLGVQKEIDVDKIWGFSSKGSVYINYGDSFNRIGVIGAIAHFVAYKTVYNQNYNPYNTYYNYYNNQRATNEMRQYLLNFKTGEIYEQSVQAVEILLMDDPELYDEYINLRRRKKKQLMFYYVRKYNEKHSIYIPVDY